MQNYLLTLAYDGTNYCGFQVQPNGRSVAQTFQDGLEAVLHSRPDIKGCKMCIRDRCRTKPRSMAQK